MARGRVLPLAFLRTLKFLRCAASFIARSIYVGCEVPAQAYVYFFAKLTSTIFPIAGRQHVLSQASELEAASPPSLTSGLLRAERRGRVPLFAHAVI
jgi:hypothetical protein